jgi:hypothetical protein
MAGPAPEEVTGPRRVYRLAAAVLLTLGPTALAAQEAASAPATRAAVIEQAQSAKATQLRPYQPNKVEAVLNGVEDALLTGRIKVHPFFDSAYAGGGFTLGAGYGTHVSAYNVIDLRGSITFSGYKRLEAAFMAPRLFHRRGVFNAVGGWREATQVGFYGTGTENTSVDHRANYSFRQPYASAVLEVRPVRNMLVFGGGLEISEWQQGAGGGSAPSVEEVYTPAQLPGLGSSPTYLHSQATFAIDSRASALHARRGGYYGVSFHDFRDTGDAFGFRRTDYEAIQHVPLLRDTWVVSLHGRLQLANAAHDQTIPFFMLPALGGGSTLRGFSSWRFRDMNSLLLQAEWRVLANRFLDMAFFYDAGRVSAQRSDLASGPLKSDYGLGFRFHSDRNTPLRIEFAKSNEGLSLVFSTKAAF